MSHFLLPLLKWFVERQILKWGRDIDWEKVRADAKKRIAALVPGTNLDDAAIYLTDVFISVASAYFVKPEFDGVDASTFTEHVAVETAARCNQGAKK
jgi:hypothetical protein